YVVRGQNGTAGFFFRQCNFFAGPAQVVGSTATPIVFFNGAQNGGVGGTLKFENSFFNRRGIAFTASPPGLQIDSRWHYIQGSIMPLFSLLNIGGVIGNAALRVENYTLDTTQEPLAWLAGGIKGVINIDGGVGPTGPTISGGGYNGQNNNGAVAVQATGLS